MHIPNRTKSNCLSYAHIIGAAGVMYFHQVSRIILFLTAVMVLAAAVGVATIAACVSRAVTMTVVVLNSEYSDSALCTVN
jgi:hypothetical protein